MKPRPDVPSSDFRPEVVCTRLVAALKAIDLSPDVIADHLHLLGVRGESAITSRHPLGAYLTARVGERVEIAGRRARVDADDYEINVRLPERVRYFADDFGNGSYDNLIGDYAYGTTQIVFVDIKVAR